MAPSRGRPRLLVAAAVGVATFGVACASPASASPAWEVGWKVSEPSLAASQSSSAAAGRIVFQRTRRAGPTFIFTAAPDGSDQRRLTRGRSTAPRWSPDGRRIAYTHNGAIWVMRGNGTHKHRLLADARFSAWAPHGRRLLVNGQMAAGRTRFGIFSLRTRTLRWYPLGDLNGGVLGFDWSWRSDRIAFAASRNADALADIYTVAPDFTGLTQVTHTPHLNEIGQRWAPAGSRRLVYQMQDFNISDVRPCHDRVVVLRLADAARTRVRCAAGDPAWSPKSGRLLLARHVPHTPDYDLVRVDLDTGYETVLVPHSRFWMLATAADWRPPRLRSTKSDELGHRAAHHCGRPG